MSSLNGAARHGADDAAGSPAFGRLLFETGRLGDARAFERDDKARYHFEQSPADRLPSPVKDEVGRFLDRIDNRKRWSSTISLALAPESNPVRRTGRKTVEIGGAPWQLDPESRSASGTGVHLSGGTSFSPPISGGLTGVLAATGSAKLYRESDWNDVSFAGDVGLASRMGGSATIQAGT